MTRKKTICILTLFKDMTFFCAILVMTTLATPHARAQQQLQLDESEKYVPDEIIVKFKAAASRTQRQHAIGRRGHRKMRDLGRPELTQIKINRGEDLKAMLSAYNRDPNVEFAQHNYRYRATSTTPNDPLFWQLWALKNDGQTIFSWGGPNNPNSTNNPGVTGYDMNLPAAWDYLTDCSSVIVAVIDSGIQYNHADLVNNMWDGSGVGAPNHGWDFVDNDNDPMDQNGHGTHVAGIIAAEGNNGVGTTGVCWKAKLMALRALDTTGAGTTGTIATAVDWARAQGAKVINMSLGGSTPDPTLATAIDNARVADIVVATAAGNNGKNNDTIQYYPCNYSMSNIVCVGAIDQAYQYASFSNFGQFNVDIAAPGTNIVSEWPGTVTAITDPLSNPPGGWTNVGGGWGYTTLAVSGTPYGALVNPANYNHFTATYADAADNRMYQTFNLTGADVATLEYYLARDFTANDSIKTAYFAGGGDPFAAGMPTLLDSLTGTSSGTAQRQEYDITPCIGMTCSIGFQVTSDATTHSFGAAILLFQLNLLAYNLVSYNVTEGTSMATPHVSGLAAMIRAMNPSFASANTIEQLYLGARTLNTLIGSVKNGRVADAWGSVSYLRPTTGTHLVSIQY